MLRLDLARLEREGSLHLRAEIPAEDPLWEGSGLALETPLTVDLRAQEAASGEVVVRGHVEGVLRSECTRCLERVLSDMEEDLTLVYAPEDLLSEEGDVRVIPHGARELDLGADIREELILSVNTFVVCDPGCRGLCPRCGTNLNRETCDCAQEESDPRWDVLRALRSE